MPHLVSRSRLSRAAAVAAAIGLSSILPSLAQADLFGRGPDADIRSMLARLPAAEWTPEQIGFSAFDLAAMRTHLALPWPETWPAGDRDAMFPIVMVATLAMPTPFALSPYLDSELLGDTGLHLLRLDGLAELLTLSPRYTALAGDGLADRDQMTAALGPGNPAAGGDASSWPAEQQPLAPIDDQSAIVALHPDMVAIYDTGAPADRAAAALAGDIPGLADLPPVALLLDAVDGPDRQSGDLVALWAMQTVRIARAPLIAEWPPDADLPQHQLVGAGLRLDGGSATSLIVLVYDNNSDADRAQSEMRARLPELADRLLLEPDAYRGPDAVSLVNGENGGAAVVISFAGQTPQSFRPGSETAYQNFTKLVLLYFDLDPIGPFYP